MYPEFKKLVNLIGHEITIAGYATLPNPLDTDSNLFMNYKWNLQRKKNRDYRD